MNVRVHTEPLASDYDVVIEPGGLEQLSDYLTHTAPAHAYAVIADSNVAQIYGERVRQALEQTGAHVVSLEFPAGEHSKDAARWASLTDELIANGLSRDSSVIALGGGVTTDLAGFVAATFMRGVPLVHIPTTLLAMIDAAIGGKTGIDTAAGKNLIGAFHQPSIVLVDPLLLRTLPERELRFGLAEAIKHGAIADADYVAWIASSAAAIFDRKTDILTSLITSSVEIKARFVSADVQEQGARAALNFGHTIAHALESVSNYHLAHGDAVSLGMIVEAAAGERVGVTASGTEQRLRAVLEAVGLPTVLPREIATEHVLNATRTDKKTRARVQRYTLLNCVGEVARQAGKWTTPLPDDIVSEALTRISANK